MRLRATEKPRGSALMHRTRHRTLSAAPVLGDSGSPRDGGRGSSERGVALRGPAAAAWLERRGFEVSDVDGVLQVFADEVSVGGFELRRVWVTSCRLARRSTRVPGRELVATLFVDGDGTVSDPHGPAGDLGPGVMVLRPLTDEFSIAWSQPVAFIQIESEWHRVSPGGVVGPLPLTLPDSFAHVFVSVATAILNSTISPDDRGFSEVRRSVESALAAGLANQRRTIEYQSSSFAKRRLFERATALIDARYGDPSLTLANLSAELSVSGAYLQRAFRGAGTTPIRYLQRVRATNARASIEATGTADPAVVAAIASRNGFNSASIMRAVVAREFGSSD